jgi:hypothetical protein
MNTLIREVPKTEACGILAAILEAIKKTASSIYDSTYA